MEKKVPKVGDEVLAFRPLKNAGSLGPHDPEWEGGMRCRVTNVTTPASGVGNPFVQLEPVGGLQIGRKTDFELLTSAEAATAGKTQWAEWAGD